MRSVVVIMHDIRSTHNVGSLLRTAEGLGIETVYMTGYTPYPRQEGDSRLPYMAEKLHAKITKTALGAETSQPWVHHVDIAELIRDLKQSGYSVCALEQTASSQLLSNYKPPQKLAIVLGREVEGVATEVLSLCDEFVEIPMSRTKESYNVVQAAAMMLYTVLYERS